jgi:hypothetical protein
MPKMAVKEHPLRSLPDSNRLACSARLVAAARRFAAELVRAELFIRAVDALVAAAPEMTVTNRMFITGLVRVDIHALRTEESTPLGDFNDF